MFDFSVKTEFVINVPSGSFIFRNCEFKEEENPDGSSVLQVDYDIVGGEGDVNEWEVGKVILHLIEEQLKHYGEDDTQATDTE